MLAVKGVYDGKKLKLNRKLNIKRPTEVVLIIGDKKTVSRNKNMRYDFSKITGKLKWKGDALKEQRKLRDEW